MRTLLRLMMVIVLVLVAVWLFKNISGDRTGVRAQGALQGAMEKVDRAVADLDLKSITEELKRTGRVIRRRAAQVARKIGDDTEDSRTTAAIKAKLAADAQLSPLSVGVDTADGRVTLSGTVNSPADIARAIEIAFEQPSVSEVISNLQVRSLRESGGSGPSS
jgi:osmotically-inducible protein OsmY